MLTKLFKLLDFFLPEHIGEIADIPVLYRARLVVAFNFIGILNSFLLLIGSIWLKLGIIFQINVLCSFFSFFFLNFYFKSRKKNFERSLFLGSLLQIIFLFALVVMTAFSKAGTGFFGLIWLIPIFYMIAFYFKPRPAFFIFCTAVVALFFIMDSNYLSFYGPVDRLFNFREMYVSYYVLIALFCFGQSIIFVQLNNHLQEELSKQKDRLMESAKFQSLGQMASNLAHDINNPLFTIQGKLHQIRNLFSNDQLDLEKCDQIIENVETTILRLSQIVKGISTFARQGSGDQMVSIGAKELLEGILLISSDRINQNQISLNVNIPETVKVICYPSFISQVLLNLLNNAIDALEYSTIKRIEVEVKTNKEWVEFWVSDSGEGIPSEIEKKIFEPFFTTKKFGKGTGLGLSISKGLIETHGGELKYLRSNDLTSFIIRLPSYE